MKKIVIACDSYKGCLSSSEVARAAAEGVAEVYPDCEIVRLAVADGGEGTVDALVDTLGGHLEWAEVSDPLGRPVKAVYGVAGDLAIIESAAACGLTLLTKEERNPLITTTRGLGELILAAIDKGCRRFLIGLGGSATNDGGAGIAQALGARLLDANGRDLEPGGAALARLDHIDTARMDPRLADTVIRIATDVTNPLTGPTGASAVFGPQKGATPEMVASLDSALAHFASVSGGDPSVPGAGAAGGLGYAFREFLGGELRSGVDIVLEEVGFEDAVRRADLVVTGEGRLDSQTVMGKAPIGVARMAKRHGKKVLAFSGCVTPDAGIVNDHGIDAFFPILRTVSTIEEALDKLNAASNLAATAEQVFRCFRLGEH